MRLFTILIEEDYASNNVCIYVPELRLSVVGDTEEEALISVKDLIQIKCGKTLNPATYKSKVMTVQIDVDSDQNYKQYSNAV